MYNRLCDHIPDNAHNRAYLKDFPAMAEEFVRTPIEVLPYSKFRLYQETGSRVEYENCYIDHRKRVDVLYAMLLTGHDEYLRPLEDALCAICEEYSWALPAHIAADATPEQEITRIDLFASETAFMLSEILYVCGSRFAKPVQARIYHELNRRIVDPYINTHPTWGKHNWSAVCANGVLTTMIYLGKDREFAMVRPWILGSLQDFLDSFNEDGCCQEGALYWSYGFGNFVYAASLLREYTHGEIDYFAMPKIRSVARFGFSMYFHGNATIPFADGPHFFPFNIGMYHFLKKEYPELPLPDEKYETQFGQETRCRFADFTRNLFWYDPTLVSAHEFPPRIDYPQTQWYIRNRAGYSFTCKGGNNEEPHNHDDIGSFFVLKGDRFLLDDPGWPEYDRDYFKPEARYTRYICSMSEGHSLPILNGKPQGWGGNFRSRVIAVEDNRISLDLSGAYDIPGLSLVRTWTLTENTVRITDEISGAADIIERFSTRISPDAEPDGTVRILDSVLTPDVPAAAAVSSQNFIPRLVSHVGLNDLETLYLIDYHYTQNGTYSFVLDIR